MKIERYSPSKRLKPFIKTFRIIESENGLENRILPDTSLVMAFRYKGSVAYTEEGLKRDIPASVVTGLRKSTRLMNYSKEAATLLVTFNEGGAAPFFNEPLHELFGMSVSLDQLIHRRHLSEIEERLAEAKNNWQRISIAEGFLLSLLEEPRLDPLILRAIQKIKDTNGNLRIKELATSLSISQDPFEKRFRRVIGTSPKQFSNIVRLRHLIEGYQPAISLTDTALVAGYFDQAHFIKEFKSFTGQTPKDFFQSPPAW
jgi:AraC-like DNA-binding protein